VRRTRGLVAVLAALVVVPSAFAARGVTIAGTDASGYPTLVVNVLTGRPVAKAPRLTEDGAPIDPLSAVNLGKRKDVVLAIDNSQSMKGAALRDATAAARAFVAAKSGGDRISVVSFGRHVIQLTGFSGTSAQSAGVLGGLHVDTTQGTSLYDAVVAAAKALGASDRPGRVVIVLTDGKDVSSTSSLDEAVAAARRANASVYPIGIESRDFDPAALRAIANETGGTYHSAGSSAELKQVYASIASELDRTWRIGYDTAARPGDHVLVRAVASGAGAAVHTVVIPTAFGGDVQPSGGPLPAAAYTPFGTVVLGLLVGALILGAVLTLVRLRRGSWVQQRLAPHVVEKRKHGRGQDERLSVLKALFRATEGAFGRHSQWESVSRLLTRGDVPLRAAEFLWLSLGCGLGGGILFAAGGAPKLMVLVGMGLAGSLPYAFVSFRVRKRSKAFENQLPDLLTTIAASLKAGHSFKHGLQAVVDESQPPASIELRRVLTEAGLGRPLDDALTDMADRLASENFAFAITAVTIQRQVGGSLASLFDMVSETVRNRQQFARKIRSLTAMGRMSAYTLIGIPFFITGMISLTNAGYMSPLFHTHLGHMLVILGLAMMAVGSMLLKKIVSFRG
jgi:tight adherence protein B